MEKKETYVGEKFIIDGDEYLRIEGVWFKWTEDKYIVISDCKYEEEYKRRYTHDRNL